MASTAFLFVDTTKSRHIAANYIQMTPKTDPSLKCSRTQCSILCIHSLCLDGEFFIHGRRTQDSILQVSALQSFDELWIDMTMSWACAKIYVYLRYVFGDGRCLDLKFLEDSLPTCAHLHLWNYCKQQISTTWWCRKLFPYLHTP